MAGVPDFNAGAMENWGLVLYRESSLLYQSNVSTADQKRGVSAIIGHELAHMVFGNLLTCDWWSDTWLNEGFARYMQYDLMYESKPSWNLVGYSNVTSRKGFLRETKLPIHYSGDKDAKQMSGPLRNVLRCFFFSRISSRTGWCEKHSKRIHPSTLMHCTLL